MRHRTLAITLALSLVVGAMGSCGPATPEPQEPDDQSGQDASAKKEFKHCPLENWGWGAEYDAKIVAIVKDPKCNPSDRKDAIQRAGDMRIYEAMPYLFDILENDDDPNMRVTAIEALGTFGTKRVLRPFEALLDDPDPQVSTAAAKSIALLANWGDRYAVHLMKELAANEDRDDLHTIAVVALGRGGKFMAVSELIELTKSDQATIRGDAAEALGYIGSVEAVDPLVALLDDEDKTVRSKACMALGSLGDPKAAPKLLEVAKGDSDRYVRSDAANALGRIAAEDMLPELVTILEDADTNERWGYQYAVGSYGTLAYDDAVELVGSEKKGLRQSGVSILSQIHDKRAKEHLIEALDDPSQEVRMDAARAIGQLAGDDVVKALLARYKKEKTEDVRSEILRSMGYIGDPKFVPVLVQASKDEANRLRAEAVRALGNYKDEKSRKAVVEALGSDNEWVREAAAATLGQMRAVEAKEPLLELLEDDDAYVRMTAIDALAWVGDASIVPKLAPLATDKDENVRRAVLRTLGHFGGKEAMDILIAALDDEKEYVRETALRSLGQILHEREIDDIKPFMVAFSKGLEDTDYYVKREAAYRLAELRYPFPEGVSQGLIGALDSADDYVLEEIVWALSRLDDADVVERLLAIVKESRIGVDTSLEQAIATMDPEKVEPGLLEIASSDDTLSSASAMLALSYLGSEKAQEIILPALGSDNGFTRQIAASALGICGDAEAVPALDELLDDPDEDVRMEALYSLGQVGRRHPEEVDVARIVAMLDQDNPREASAAASALALVEDRSAAPKLLALFKDNATKIKSLGCGIRCGIVASYGGALAVLGDDPETEKALVEMLEDPHPRTRTEAAHVLASIATKQSVKPLIEAVERENDIYVRDSIIMALASTKSPKAVGALKALIPEADSYTMAVIIRALGETGGKKEEKIILEYLEHPKTGIQTAAIDASGSMKLKKAVPKLLEMLEDPTSTPWIETTVYEALVHIGEPKGCEPVFEKIISEGEILDEILNAGLTAAALRIEPVRPVFEKRVKKFGLSGRFLDLVAFLYGDEDKGNELFQWLLELRIPRRNYQAASFVMASFTISGDQGRKYLETLEKEAQSSFVSSSASMFLEEFED